MTGRPLLAATAATVALLAAAIPAHAAQRICPSADLRYPFTPGGPKTFGVFRLTVSGGSCATARRAARAFQKKLEASTSPAPPRSAGGFTFTTLPATAAQTFRERGRRGGVTVRFDYVVPNG